MVTKLVYADDTTLLAGTKEDLIERVKRIRRASEKAGLYLNVGKTKVMTLGHVVRAGGMEDARDNEWIETDRKTKTNMAGHTQGVFELSHHQQHETIRQI